MLCWVSRESVLGFLGCLWWVSILQASVFEWMQRTLEVEFKEWFREEEPETDHQGFFQSALPAIVMQVGSQEHGYRWGHGHAETSQKGVRGLQALLESPPLSSPAADAE